MDFEMFLKFQRDRNSCCAEKLYKMISWHITIIIGLYDDADQEGAIT
jgi:hypothetical protein